MTLAPLLIQIQRWLMLPHVWRFVGFSSTAVGLFCYAEFLLQTSIWAVEFVENLCLLYFQRHHLPCDFVCKGMATQKESPIQSSYGIYGFNKRPILIVLQPSCLLMPPPPENYAGHAVLVTRLKACIKLIRKNDRIPIRMLFKHASRYLKTDYVNFSENKGELAGLLLRTDPILVLDMLPSEAMNVLHKTVKLMVAGGFEEECCQVYSSFRREFLQQSLSAFGIRDQLSIEDVENKTNLFLLTRIDSWTKAFNIALRTLFPNEKRLCDRVFFGLSSSAADHSFKEVCKDLTMASINIQTPLAIDLNKNNRAKVQQSLEQYQRSTWSEVLDILKMDDNEPLRLDAAAELMKEKLQLFNVHFEGTCSIQSTWFALDEHLRKEVIISFENFLLPAYGNFIGRLQDVVGKPTYDYVKYGMSEIQARLIGFLLGSNWQYQ